MKRRDGSTRRQVLDMDHSSSSWKNKYSNIAQRNVNGSGDSSSNPLSKLVGSYASESDEDDDNSKNKNTLDAKVEEFMKEVESTKTNEDVSSITCAWQECHDKDTGYPYYWNMNTNEVTWEPPPELVAYQATLTAKIAQTQAKVKAQAQQAQWAVEQAALGITPEYPQKRIPTAVQTLKKPPKSTPPPILPQSTKGKKQKRVPNRPPSSESDDEKIEMITSWVDEESEDEDEPPVSGNHAVEDKKKVKETAGPQTKAPASSRKSVKPPKPGPLPNVMFGPQLPSNLPVTAPSKIRSGSRNGSTEDNEVESKVVIQKLRRLKTESDVIVGTRERVPVRKSLDRSRSGSPNDRLTLKNRTRLHDGDNEHLSEKSLLSKLSKQVQILKDLGGSVPADIKDLLSSSTKSSINSADNIIAMIEMEQPPDHKQDVNFLSSLKAAEHRIQREVQKIQADKLVNGSEKSSKKEQKPSSFALIAGYGDDSDQDDAADSDTSVHSAKVEKPSKEKSLFPILGHEESSKEDVKTVPKFTLGADSSTSKANSDSTSKPALVLDAGVGQKRRKRLDIGAILPQPLPSTSNSTNVSNEENSKSTLLAKGTSEVSSGTTSYTTVWSSTSTYASDPTANDRRGFGFPVVPCDEEEPIPSNTSSNTNKPKKSKIQFIKAETINKQQDDSTNVRESGKDLNSKNTTSKSREDGELHRSLSSLAQLVKAKLQFLSEGKEPVSPVQAMAIQIETLVSAWNAGALTNAFLQRWLQSTGAELVQLERAAAPQGWAVQWDREYKRYFYCNLATKDTQWDYPLVPEDGHSKPEEPEPSNAKPQSRVATPPPDDEDAMELCTTPPPEEEAEIGIPPRPCSPPLEAPPCKRSKTEDESADSNDIPEHPSAPPVCPPLPSTPPPPLPSTPPPPPPPPETPPPPPPGTPPPGTPPPATPAASRVLEHGEPLPPGVDSPDVPFIAVRPAMPPTPLALPVSADLAPHMDHLEHMDHMGVLNPMQSLHPGSVLGVPVLSGVPGMAMQYTGGVAVSGSYVAPPPTEAMLASFNHATAVDYMGYMGVYAGPAGPMPVTSVAAPPLAYTGPAPQPPSHPPVHMPHRKKEALMSELSSFYSDLASMDSNSRDATEDDTSQDAAEHSRVKTSTPPVPPAPVLNPTVEEVPKQPLPEAPLKSQSSIQDSEGALTKKKKKTKLTPGLTLKKKGVSNLVAKWQQVQQEVWKDYEDEEAVE
ncbi:formin-binding protein 4-like [Thrips palmi]|uniref:Formin-binding protein 4-like n=1 Tax=Thrips palmi TaxID=161013 RepID=A0A6P9A919_THRPL|nr:formin-binding protein 4-like [Thrips palmi]